MGNITISFTNEGTGVTLSHVYNITDANLLRFVDYVRNKYGTVGGNPPEAPVVTPVTAQVGLKNECDSVVQEWRRETIVHETRIATANAANAVPPLDVTGA